MRKIRFPTNSDIRAKWKTVLTIVVALTAAFTIGAFANKVVVQNVDSLAGNHVLVLAPELVILSSSWNLNVTASLVTGVRLNVTTVGAPGSTTVLKSYQIVVQVSCLDTAGSEFTCATGTATSTLPSNMFGASVTIRVNVSPSIDPERTEVHDLSFIVTGTPVPSPPTVSLVANPSTISFAPKTASTAPLSANTTITLISFGGFSGNVTYATAPGPLPPGSTVMLNPQPLPPFPSGFSAFPPPTPGPVELVAGGALKSNWMLTVAPTTPPGNYKITFVATTASGQTLASLPVILLVPCACP